ncbi:MAG: Gfo/Idh/MocA family protein, partial [Acidimicrobiales bacterium]
IASLVNLVGPVAEIAGMARIGVTPRVVTAAERTVETIDVTVPTHTSASLRFANGAVGTVMMSFDVWSHDLPYVEIYGAAGRLRVPDPDNYDGDVLVKSHDSEEWEALEPIFPPSGEPGTEAQWLRGMGVMDLVRSLAGEAQRTTGRLGYHVLEVLDAVARSAEERRYVPVELAVEQPPALPESLLEAASTATP